MSKESPRILFTYILIILALVDLISVILSLLHQINIIFLIRGAFLLVLLGMFAFKRNKLFFLLLQAWIILGTAGGVLILLGMLLQYIGNSGGLVMNWTRLLVAILNVVVGLYLILNIDDVIEGLSSNKKSKKIVVSSKTC